MRFKLYWMILIFGVLACSACTPQATSQEQAGRPSETAVVVRILNLDIAVTPSAIFTTEPLTLTDTPVRLPSPTPQANQTEETPFDSSSTERVCTDKAEFVRSLSISDNTALEAGQPFTKVWQIQNMGTCVWSTDYTLRFYSGDAMQGPSFIHLPHPVDPGGTVDVHIAFVAPNEMASYTGNWVLADAEGKQFGFGPAGDQVLSVIIQVKPTPKAAPS